MKPLVIFLGLAALVFFIVLYRRLIKPYRILLDGIELMKEQDFSTRLRPVGHSGVDRLVELFNRMMAMLRSERLRVRETNRFLDLLIDASPQGVVIFDLDGRITDINPAGMRLLGILRLDDVTGKTIANAGFELSATLAELYAEGDGADRIVRGEGPTVYRCIRSSFVDQGFPHPFILIEELTREMREMERAAYEKVIRMMSHEVNNSVGAIGATLDVVSDIFRGDGMSSDVLEAVEASSGRCVQLARFVGNLADVVRVPSPALSEISLNGLVRTVESLTRLECQRRGISLVVELPADDRTVLVDGIQMEQVLINLVKNAWEAIGGGGEIRIVVSDDPLSIAVEDNGPGIPREVGQNLFAPFFTTKPKGQGVGLMFVREVLLNHGMAFRFGSHGSRTRFEILFRQ